MSEPALFDAHTGYGGAPVYDYRRGPGVEHRPKPSRSTALAHAVPAEVEAVDRWIDTQGDRRWSADDIRAELILSAATIKALGSIVGRAARAGRIVEAGFTRSRTPSRRSSPLLCWTGAQ